MYCDNPYSLNFEPNYGGLVNQLPQNNFSGITENWGSLLIPVKQSLVLDGEKGELVKASGRMEKKGGVSDRKTMEALKSHSESERRRRERINAHLTSLRALVPNNEKMDKAALLAEVITQVKQLKKTATQASEGIHIPMDTDEVKLETLENNMSNGSFLLRASLCCDYSSDLLSDVRKAIKSLPVRVLKSEISTLGSRVKVVFLIATNELNAGNAVHLALSNVLDKVTATTEYAQQLFIPRKRQRVSCPDSLCDDDIC